MASKEKRAIRKVNPKVHLVGLVDNVVDNNLVGEKILVPLFILIKEETFVPPIVLVKEEILPFVVERPCHWRASLDLELENSMT